MGGKKCYCKKKSRFGNFVLKSIEKGKIPYYIDICLSRAVQFVEPTEKEKVEKLIFQYSFLITNEDSSQVLVCSRNDRSHFNSQGKNSVLFSCSLDKSKIPQTEADLHGILRDEVIALNNVKSCEFLTLIKRTVTRGEEEKFGQCEYISFVYHVRVDLNKIPKSIKKRNDIQRKSRNDSVDIWELRKAIGNIKDDFIGLVSLSLIANLKINDRVKKSVVYLPARGTLNPMIKSPPTVFICHANKKEDNGYVRQLADILKKAGISYWVDLEHLGDTSDWRPQPIQMLKCAKYVLIICTGNMLNPGEGVIRELKELENKKEVLHDCPMYKIFFGKYDNEKMLGGRFKEATGSSVVNCDNQLQKVVEEWAKKNQIPWKKGGQ